MAFTLKSTQSANLAQKRVLLVDDENAIRETLSAILRRYGLIVITAATLADAFQEIHSKRFDLLLCDLNIERKSDGLEVVREMRKTNPDCIVVILTGCPAMDTAAEATRLGADDYIAKPASVDMLVAMIGERLHGAASRARVSPVEPTTFGKLTDEVLRLPRPHPFQDISATDQSWNSCSIRSGFSVADREER